MLALLGVNIGVNDACQMSLAEELLADLEDDDEEELQDEAAAAGGELETEITVNSGNDNEDGMDVDGTDAKAGTDNTLEAVVKYYDSEELRGVMDKIERFSAKQVSFDAHQY